MLERGERIELLVDRTETLDQHALKFKKVSTNLKRAMWWKNVKILILIGFAFLCILYIIIGSYCGFGFECFQDDKNNNGN